MFIRFLRFYLNSKRIPSLLIPRSLRHLLKVSQFSCFLQFSLAELTAYAGLVGMVVTAGNYVFKAIAETNAKLNQVPSLLAKVQYDLSTKSDRRHKATLRAINALRRA